MKLCPCCKRELPEEAFHRDWSKRDHRCCICKECKERRRLDRAKSPRYAKPRR